MLIITGSLKISINSPYISLAKLHTILPTLLLLETFSVPMPASENIHPWPPTVILPLPSLFVDWNIKEVPSAWPRMLFNKQCSSSKWIICHLNYCMDFHFPGWFSHSFSRMLFSQFKFILILIYMTFFFCAMTTFSIDLSFHHSLPSVSHIIIL